MNFVMAYYLIMFVVILITHETITNGQCTVQGCDNGDSLTSIFAEMIQQLRVDLFDQLKKQVQSINELSAAIQDLKSHHATTVDKSFQAPDRCHLERDICREQFQSMHEIFNESFHEMKSQHDAIVTNLQAIDRRLEEHDISTMNQTRNSLEEHYISIGNQTRNYLEEHDVSIRNQTQSPWTITNVTCGPASEVCDCSDIKASGQNRSGVYEVCVGRQHNRTCTSAFCEMETADGASLVFQRRKDDSVNFSRTWTEYKEGFGNSDGEFWLGNEMLHLLTSKRNYKLRVELEAFDGNKSFAEYSTFSINSSADNYRLTINGYSGNAGDSMSYHNSQRFSTIDVDNDLYHEGNCALLNGGGWWFRVCLHSSLNGMYCHEMSCGIQKSNNFGIKWSSWRGWYHALKATEMKLVAVA